MGETPSHAPAAVGLGLESTQQSFDGLDNYADGGYLDPEQQRQQLQAFSQGNLADPAVFDPNFDQHQHQQQQQQLSGSDPNLTFAVPSQHNYTSPSLDDPDFALFPPTGGPGDQFTSSLFDHNALGPNSMTNMASSPSQPQGGPNSPGLQPNAGGHQSPAFNQQHFSPEHSRNTSLGPEAALLPNQISDWNQPQFHGHRRTASDYSDVSSVSPSPNMPQLDSFDDMPGGHSPLQRASVGSMYSEVLGIGNFSLSDNQVGSPGQTGRSPSHSPAISPRLMPQHLSDPSLQSFEPVSGDMYGAGLGMQGSNEAFPNFGNAGSPGDASQMVTPAINIDFAPSTSGTGLAKSAMDQDSLTPPQRGRLASRPRSVTDPFHPGGGGSASRPDQNTDLISSLGSELSNRNGSSRSLSPFDRLSSTSASPHRRRRSTSAVPNNAIALKLADPLYQGGSEHGGAKRVQKHPATFQCTLCPKRFTRAYNLRSHLRTHTDERPFVCTVCSKAFARQHDRKRHESLHSGEKKFVCKGELTAGGQWGCGRRFARADALGRHFRSEAGRICIKPLLDEEMLERQRQFQEQRIQENMAQNMVASQNAMGVDAYPMDATGNFLFPAALLAQYPALAQINFSGTDMGVLDDDISGRSSFDASDYDDGDDGGYLSGPGFDTGGVNQGYANEMGYSSDLGGR